MPLRRLRFRKLSPAAAARHLFDGIPHRVSSPIEFSAAVRSSDRASLPAFHAVAVTTGLAGFAAVTNSLAARYAKTGSFPTAVKVFDAARARDVSSYNTILSAFPDPAEALGFAAWMLRSGAVRPDAVTCTVALSLAAGQREEFAIRQLHALAWRFGLAADVFVGNALVTAYTRGGYLEEARRVFDEMLTRDRVSWNALLCGLSQDGDCPGEVIGVFLGMLKDSGVRPDRISVCSVIPACGGERNLKLGRQIHGFAVKLGVAGHVSIGNVLVAMYYKCGAPGCARRFFDAMSKRDVVSWTTAISMDGEDAAAALTLFNGMRRDGVPPNEVTFVALISAMPAECPSRDAQMIHAACIKAAVSGEAAAANSLITMYAKARSMDDARKVFDIMPRREIIAWNAMISGYAQNDRCNDALELFSSMSKCLTPNETTLASVVSAVTAVETVSMAYGQMYHSMSLKLGLAGSEYVAGALIDMCAKRGGLEESRKAFDETVHRSLIAWTAIISANAKHGSYGEVMSLFGDMVRSGVAPDGVVLLAVLAAYRYGGMVDAGRDIFESMSAYVELWPEHYACVVDMLGRAGRLTEAEELMMRMPAGPSVSALQSLLGACRIHGDAEIGERVAGILTETEPMESGAYVLLSNIYAEAGDWDGVAKVRRKMRDRGVKKEIGFSWVDAGEALHLHKFSSDDTTHPLTEEIYAVAEGLGWEMKFLKNCSQMEMI
uniref:Pentacotripeptide-repeat region of PRORP domain-containing protein n=1 Tax=Leersia perrieri TaxID=77586 RepID=A0A0D9X2R3_9ORYZ